MTPAAPYLTAIPLPWFNRGMQTPPASPAPAADILTALSTILSRKYGKVTVTR